MPRKVKPAKRSKTTGDEPRQIQILASNLVSICRELEIVKKNIETLYKVAHFHNEPEVKEKLDEKK